MAKALAIAATCDAAEAALRPGFGGDRSYPGRS
ncbi:hypothetical protein SAMN04489713_122131 [Actinomadura madurae]|uniref:Uncharacterized protein n=1 Tax=Actinomadura madurae TaxID=1993 RepID=A0A1I5W0D6_9ACTN|nr:hypothetical protein SAMN04489713_122131 [Actinomadura madurae]SPT49497.1 Uncharacterised protein [Actinomadura madurae]